MLGGKFVNGGQPVPGVVLPASIGKGSWIAAAVDDGYLKMCLINVTVAGSMAYAYVAEARMTYAQDSTWTTQSLFGNTIAVNDFYFTNSYVCMDGGFGICTKPVSSSDELGFGVYSLDYSIIGPPTMAPTSGE